GRVGIARGKLKGTLNGESDSDTSTKLYFGVGAGYDFNKSFGLSLNWDHLRGSGQDVDVKSNVLTLGAEYRF
ncbi:MAG TPA: outer membrane beta-barrel protein, partial [Xanthomonadaceae bacterium]|nr:outer membrane beta-barrel protein [Xanthomonadaceae bacterium]